MGSNIKMVLPEICSGELGWIDLAQVRDRWWAPVNIVVSLQVLHNAGNVAGRETISSSRRPLLHVVS
jgi:hypothetical protein